MAQKAIREADGKNMIARLLKEYTNGAYTIEKKFISIGPQTDPKNYQPPTNGRRKKCCLKPDQLIKRRGKSKLLLLNMTGKTQRNGSKNG